MDETMQECWPTGFGQIGGLSFEEVYNLDNDFVAITLDGMSDATGIFKRWYDFCHKKSKSKNGQTSEISDGESKGGDKSG